ncbi:MAG: LOG family protein [Deltaproteobacteria bacterium]|nr:MAG: LOG family protein [Deltaproteobacteria bacterium]
MSRPNQRRRYELKKPELNRAIEELVDQAQQTYGDLEGADYVRQLLVSALRMVHDHASSANLKLLNSAFKELRHAFRVFEPYEHVRKVAVFGSARTQPGHPDWDQAHRFAERIAAEGWMVITGAGDGIMGAAQGGAGRDASFGVNIRLPVEQRANHIIAGDPKLINFRYFFTRKVVFVKEAHAIVLFPGGFGTHDEGFEALTLMQTGKSEILPVVFVDAPGGSYWKDWEHYVRTHLCERSLIARSDLSLFKITDDVQAAIDELVSFYQNYHSSRYVGDRLVIRARRAPGPEALDALNTEFADIVTRGRIEVGEALPEEADEVQRYPRVVFHFNRRQVGRLRELIDRLNALAPDQPPSHEASPHQIVAGALTPEAERAEQDDG